MSVPKNKRTKSSIAYFDDFYKLFENIAKFLINDFGIRACAKDPKLFMRNINMTEEDEKEFLSCINKYNIGMEVGYQEWLFDYFRISILEDLRDALKNITSANTIYPNTEDEWHMRRRYQNQAIACCYDIKHLLQLFSFIFPMNVKKAVQYVEQIDIEIQNLKEWRKSGNKLRSACIKNDENKIIYTIRALAEENKIMVDKDNNIRIRKEPKEQNNEKSNSSLLDEVRSISKALVYESYSNFMSGNYQIVEDSNSLKYSNPILGVVFIDEQGNVDRNTTCKIHLEGVIT